MQGTLVLQRKASSNYVKEKSFSWLLRKQTLIFSYAQVVAEENASGWIVVTALTSGSSKVLPAVIYFLKKEFNQDKNKILNAIATANSSILEAEGICLRGK